MAAIIADAGIGALSGVAHADEILRAFTLHKRELTWIAEFLTGDETIASACVIDARAGVENKIGEERFWASPRETIIRSALDWQRVRIAELAMVYERRCCVHCEHALTPDTAQLLAIEFEAVQSRVDVLCRFVLIICGVEHRSISDAAQLLGISAHAVEGAYCAALEALDVIYSLFVVEAYGCSTTVN